MPPETASSFPDRPIRPLPKRRLRERLSPDVADTIPYPPASGNDVPLFAYPWNTKDEPTVPAPASFHIGPREALPGITSDSNSRAGKSQEDGPVTPSRRNLTARKALDVPTPLPLRSTPRPSQQRQPHSAAPPSVSSSGDGYDSFENTNNKKKRKIPTAGEVMLNGAHLLNDQAAMGVSSTASTEEDSPETTAVASAPYYQSAGPTISTQGISGPGRGRYGRVRSGRSPLRTLSDPNCLWPGRSPKTRENGGIISNAIASAEKLPPSQGQENISLLHQQPGPSISGASTSSQFTFVEKKVPWPGSRTPPSRMSGTRLQPPPVPAHVLHTNEPTANGDLKGSSAPNFQPKKPRRRGYSLVKAAKQRRKQTQENNYHHPPAPEDMWVCEYCEYERIFGTPPEALIRQYEIKDRKRRREEAERRRLLEKAKMKSRKGRKSKLPAKNNTTSHHMPAPDPSNVPGANNEPWEDNESQSVAFEEEYYEDDLPPDMIPELRPLTDDERREAQVLLDHEQAFRPQPQDMPG